MDWTQDNDLLLADRVLHGTREGIDMEMVWEGLAEKFGCLPADCQMRWEEIKPQYEMALQIAEKTNLIKALIRQPQLEKESEIADENPSKTKSEKPIEAKTKKAKSVNKKKQTKKKTKKAPDVDLDVIISYLRKMKKQIDNGSEVDKLKKEIEELKAKIQEITTNYDELYSDYADVIKILKRAQDMSEAG